MSNRFTSRIGYSGREFERDMFGPTSEWAGNFKDDLKKILSETTLKVVQEILRGTEIPKEGQKVVNESLKEIRNNKDKLIEIVKKYQRFDPTNPSVDFLRELRLAVIDELNLKTPKEMDKVKAYSALDTPLDAIGIDGFVTLKINDREAVVTFDATLRKEKLEELREADIVFGELPDSVEDEEGYLKAISELAEKAVNVLRKQI